MNTWFSLAYLSANQIHVTSVCSYAQILIEIWYHNAYISIDH
jgi:hypothetical protein